MESIVASICILTLFTGCVGIEEQVETKIEAKKEKSMAWEDVGKHKSVVFCGNGEEQNKTCFHFGQVCKMDDGTVLHCSYR